MMRHPWPGLALLTLIGCWGGTLPPGLANYDPQQARETLTTALDAWKAGQAGQLSRRTPAIQFVDDDLVAGCRLLDYELLDPEQSARPFESVRVQLRLRDRRGREWTREVGYQIILQPVRAIVRGDG